MNIDRLTQMPDGAHWTVEKSQREALREAQALFVGPEFVETYGRGVRKTDPYWLVVRSIQPGADIAALKQEGCQLLCNVLARLLVKRTQQMREEIQMQKQPDYWLFTHFTHSAAFCCRKVGESGQPKVLLRYRTDPVAIVVPLRVVEELSANGPMDLAAIELPSTIFRTGDLVPIMLAFRDGPCAITVTDHHKPVGGLVSYDLLDEIKRLVPDWSGTW